MIPTSCVAFVAREPELRKEILEAQREAERLNEVSDTSNPFGDEQMSMTVWFVDYTPRTSARTMGPRGLRRACRSANGAKTTLI